MRHPSSRLPARKRARPTDFRHPSLTGAALLAGLPLLLAAGQALAWPSYGSNVDAFCSTYDGSTPYADLGGGGDGCVLCHQDNSGNGAQPNTWDWWRNGNLDLFCTGTPPNRAPDGRITAPLTDQQISAGSTLRFEGSGSDPDGDALSFSWNFGVGTASGPGPHVIAYPDAGSYTVTLTVSDGELADPTPATRQVEVTATSGCTDDDGDGYLSGDASCAPIDCDDSDPAVNPGAVEACGDGLDNDCNGLIDGADPAAVGCAGCLDSDGDRFSPEGGLCGPIDCDDTDPAVNPGAVEDCGDGIDNDCDFYLDDTDPDCSGDDCHGRLLRDPGLGVLIARDADRRAAEPLDGLVVSGAVDVFIADRDGIELVEWFVDGEPVNTDGTAPWDLAGGDGLATLFDTRNLANGWHGITADITLNSGRQQRFTAAMLVDNDAANQPPTCTIDEPAGPVSVQRGERVRFAGSGADPDGDVPLRFLWDFDGAAANAAVENPGAVTLSRTGRFTVSLTVIDAAGLPCVTPASLSIVVTDDGDDDHHHGDRDRDWDRGDDDRDQNRDRDRDDGDRDRSGDRGGDRGWDQDRNGDRDRGRNDSRDQDRGNDRDRDRNDSRDRDRGNDRDPERDRSANDSRSGDDRRSRDGGRRRDRD